MGLENGEVQLWYPASLQSYAQNLKEFALSHRNGENISAELSRIVATVNENETDRISVFRNFDQEEMLEFYRAIGINGEPSQELIDVLMGKTDNISPYENLIAETIYPENREHEFQKILRLTYKRILSFPDLSEESNINQHKHLRLHVRTVVDLHQSGILTSGKLELKRNSIYADNPETVTINWTQETSADKEISNVQKFSFRFTDKYSNYPIALKNNSGIGQIEVLPFVVNYTFDQKDPNSDKISTFIIETGDLRLALAVYPTLESSTIDEMSMLNLPFGAAIAIVTNNAK